MRRSMQRKQLVADAEGKGGYVTLYGKHGSRTIRVGRRTWEALLRLAEGKAPDDRIIAIRSPTNASGRYSRLRPKSPG